MTTKPPRRIAQQTLDRAREGRDAGGASAAYADAVDERLVSRWPDHMEQTYGLDVTDPEVAAAVVCTLDWIADVTLNASHSGARDPVGVIVAALSGAGRSAAPHVRGADGR